MQIISLKKKFIIAMALMCATHSQASSTNSIAPQDFGLADQITGPETMPGQMYRQMEQQALKTKKRLGKKQRQQRQAEIQRQQAGQNLQKAQKKVDSAFFAQAAAQKKFKWTRTLKQQSHDGHDLQNLQMEKESDIRTFEEFLRTATQFFGYNIEDLLKSLIERAGPIIADFELFKNQVIYPVAKSKLGRMDQKGELSLKELLDALFPKEKCPFMNSDEIIKMYKSPEFLNAEQEYSKFWIETLRRMMTIIRDNCDPNFYIQNLPQDLLDIIRPIARDHFSVKEFAPKKETFMSTRGDSAPMEEYEEEGSGSEEESDQQEGTIAIADSKYIEEGSDSREEDAEGRGLMKTFDELFGSEAWSLMSYVMKEKYLKILQSGVLPTPGSEENERLISDIISEFLASQSSQSPTVSLQYLCQLALEMLETSPNEIDKLERLEQYILIAVSYEIPGKYQQIRQSIKTDRELMEMIAARGAILLLRAYQSEQIDPKKLNTFITKIASNAQKTAQDQYTDARARFCQSTKEFQEAQTRKDTIDAQQKSIQAAFASLTENFRRQQEQLKAAKREQQLKEEQEKQKAKQKEEEERRERWKNGVEQLQNMIGNIPGSEKVLVAAREAQQIDATSAPLICELLANQFPHDQQQLAFDRIQNIMREVKGEDSSIDNSLQITMFCNAVMPLTLTIKHSKLTPIIESIWASHWKIDSTSGSALTTSRPHSRPVGTIARYIGATRPLIDVFNDPVAYMRTNFGRPTKMQEQLLSHIMKHFLPEKEIETQWQVARGSAPSAPAEPERDDPHYKGKPFHSSVVYERIDGVALGNKQYEEIARTRLTNAIEFIKSQNPTNPFRFIISPEKPNTITLVPSFGDDLGFFDYQEPNRFVVPGYTAEHGYLSIKGQKGVTVPLAAITQAEFKLNMAYDPETQKWKFDGTFYDVIPAHVSE